MRFKIKFGKNKDFDPNTLRERGLLSDQIAILLEIRNERDKLQQNLKNLIKPNFTLNPSSQRGSFLDLTKIEEIYQPDFFDAKINEFEKINNHIHREQDETIKNQAFTKTKRIVNGIKELFELIFFAANFQRQTPSILNKINAFKEESDEIIRKNKINEAIITDPKNSLLILYTPELLKDISNQNLQRLLQETISIPEGIDLQVFDIFQRLISGKTCMELLKRREEQIKDPTKVSDEDLDLRPLNPREWIAALEKSPTYIEEVYTLNMHLINSIESKITEKLKPDTKTPWQLGWLGSQSKINYGNTEYFVPSTIKEIHRAIQETKKSLDENQPAIINNNHATKLLDQINELLHKKTHTEHPTWGVFLNFLKSLIGIGRSSESLETYSDFREITQLKR